jgi:hypothetical protein
MSRKNSGNGRRLPPNLKWFAGIKELNRDRPICSGYKTNVYEPATKKLPEPSSDHWQLTFADLGIHPTAEFMHMYLN